MLNLLVVRTIIKIYCFNNMATYNYLLENFVGYPTSEDKQLFIYNKYGDLVYTVDASLAYLFYKNNLVIIKSDNNEDIILDFENSATAIIALEKFGQKHGFSLFPTAQEPLIKE